MRRAIASVVAAVACGLFALAIWVLLPQGPET